MKDIVLFLEFLRDYFFSRILHYALKVEKLKDLIVALLVVKRGKYSNSFLNTSFFLLVITVLIAGPTIAENNPFNPAINESEQKYQDTTIAFDPFENSLATTISDKPRDKIENHTVKSGETLASISKLYNISTETIKWANDLKTDTIKIGQVLKIPPITGVVHKVASGDNIYSIAKKYKVDAQQIVNFPFNDFADLDTFQLTPGQVLYVPDGVIEQAQPRTGGGLVNARAGVRGNSNFIWPATGLITTYPIWYHMALDIANGSLPPVLASDTGTVVYADCIGYGYGCHVIIDHGNGYQTLYAHLSVISVSPGQVASQGQQIGVMGSTGRSTGPHLHFEIRNNGVLLNPLNFLR